MDGKQRGHGPLLEASGLIKAYGGQMVLRGVDLRIMAGERVAVMGPSGSGKSTLLHCIAGLERPDAGNIRFGGSDFKTMGENALAELRRGRMTSVFQFFHLLPTLNALENVEFPLLLLKRESGPDRRERAEALLEEVGLGDRMRALPSTLSGGEMQRLAIARALVTDPELILADEPTGSLDSANGDKILQLLRELTERHGTALLMVTHDVEASAACERVLHMRDGKWVDSAT